MKYAFIMNSATLTPKTHYANYENAENQCYFAAVHGMKMTLELAKSLADDGYEMIDLCGDYSEEKAEEVRKATDGKCKVSYAKYSEEDLARVDALERMDRYGIVVLGFDMGDNLVKLELKSEEYNTYITLVGKEEMAPEAAREMAEKGIQFIELCSYFNKDRAEAIAEAIGHSVPLGYCG